jgi:hypothetical protein
MLSKFQAKIDANFKAIVTTGPSASTSEGYRYATAHFNEFLIQATDEANISMKDLTWDDISKVTLWEQFGTYLTTAIDLRSTDPLMPLTAAQYFSGAPIVHV